LNLFVVGGGKEFVICVCFVCCASSPCYLSLVSLAFANLTK
jgi:hypothetical protein